MSEYENQPGLPIHAVNLKVSCVPENNQTFFDLVGKLHTGEISVPPHQRDANAWNTPKQRAWIDRLRCVAAGTRDHPLGSIAMYLVKSDGFIRYWLNDGHQRISTCRRALNLPIEFGFFNKGEVEAILRASNAHVQTRQYEKHADAAEDFEEVNKGTGLLPAERYKAVLVYEPEWPTWKEFLTQWNSAVQAGFQSFCLAPGGREARIVAGRAYHLLFANAVLGQPSTMGNNNHLEKAVVQALKTCGESDLKRYIKLAEGRLAEIEKAWRSLNPEPALVMQEKLGIWCLGVMLRNDDLAIGWWQTFLTTLLKRTGDKPVLMVERPGASPEYINLTHHFHMFSRICQALELEREGKPTRRHRSRSLRRGYHDHHPMPVSKGGGDVVVPIPARINLSLGAKGLEQEGDRT